MNKTKAKIEILRSTISNLTASEIEFATGIFSVGGTVSEVAEDIQNFRWEAEDLAAIAAMSAPGFFNNPALY